MRLTFTELRRVWTAGSSSRLCVFPCVRVRRRMTSAPRASAGMNGLRTGRCVRFCMFCRQSRRKRMLLHLLVRHVNSFVVWAETYVQYHLGRGFDSLAFYRSLQPKEKKP